jgi:hypothetical protein
MSSIQDSDFTNHEYVYLYEHHNCETDEDQLKLGYTDNLERREKELQQPNQFPDGKMVYAFDTESESARKVEQFCHNKLKDKRNLSREYQTGSTRSTNSKENYLYDKEVIMFLKNIAEEKGYHTVIDNTREYNVQYIYDHKLVNGVNMFKVKWEGYVKPSWEPYKKLKHLKDVFHILEIVEEIPSDDEEYNLDSEDEYWNDEVDREIEEIKNQQLNSRKRSASDFYKLKNKRKRY